MIKIAAAAFRFINRLIDWHRLPFPISVLNLVLLRHDLRERNLFDSDTEKPTPPDPDNADFRSQRMPDGSFNDLSDPGMGMAATRFGRNVPFTMVGSGTINDMLDPNPRLVSTALLARRKFIPATTLNVLAPAWLQFMVHDWVGHENVQDDRKKINVPLPDGDDWAHKGHRKGHMSIRPTKPDAAQAGDAGRPVAFLNKETHWWDASQIYGSSKETADRLRRSPKGATLPDGKLYLDKDGHLPRTETGLEDAGVNANWWIGLSVMHHLFVMEHNAIIDRLKVDYPDRDGDWLFEKARLINAAVIAKIHTVEWTPALLNNPTMRYAMRGNWWGALGEIAERAYGRSGSNEVLAGIPGSGVDHHTAAYAMTEEFTAVYRMHPLMPDEFEFSTQANTGSAAGTKTLGQVAGRHASGLYDDFSLADITRSLATANPGALRLHNFPNMLREFTKQGESGHVIDLGTIDILRDRERGVPRYCEFRRAMRMSVPSTFAELTGGDKASAKAIEAVYGDVNKVDLLVGTLAEPLPDGFAFSDTAFRVFILMASRRLKSDRFFAADFNDGVYTPAGMQWIRDTLMSDVIARHLPELAVQVKRSKNAFFPWPTD